VDPVATVTLVKQAVGATPRQPTGTCRGAAPLHAGHDSNRLTSANAIRPCGRRSYW